MADWAVGAARDLPLNQTASWDGGEATRAVFEWAGGDDFDASKAKRAFLVYDKSASDQRGAYKLPFARPVEGTLTAIRAGLNNAASRLPQTHIPPDVRDNARRVVDAYQTKYRSLLDAPRYLANGLERRDAYTADAPVLLALRSGDDDLDGIPGYDGYVATFHTVDHHGTFFTPGAFKRSIKERGALAPVLWQHERNLPIGSHIELREDERGLFVRTRITEGTVYGANTLALLRDRVPLGLSFGFKRLRDRPMRDGDEVDFGVSPEWNDESRRNEIRAITEVQFWESSPCVFASNELAAPTAVRGYSLDDALAQLLLDLEQGTLTTSQRDYLDELTTRYVALTAAAGAVVDDVDESHHRTVDEMSDQEIALALACARSSLALTGGFS